MVHALARKIEVAEAQRLHRRAREAVVLALGFLKAQDIDVMILNQLLDQVRAGADAVDVPRSDAKRHGGDIDRRGQAVTPEKQQVTKSSRRTNRRLERPSETGAQGTK